MIQTFSKFFYDFAVTSDNKYLSFDEGSGELVAEIRPGNYGPTQGLDLVAESMSNVGTQAYSVTMNRSTRLVTISAAAPFDLLVGTGSTAPSSIFPLIGFTGADRTGLASYQSNNVVAREYVPQFKFQDWIDPDHFRKSVDATVKKTANGEVEAVVFGVERLIQLNIKYVTDLPMDQRVIKNNPNGVSDLVDLMVWLIKKAPVELMPDENAPANWYDVILDRTTESQNGTDFRLKELYDRNLPGFFETGNLTFRVIE